MKESQNVLMLVIVTKGDTAVFQADLSRKMTEQQNRNEKEDRIDKKDLGNLKHRKEKSENSSRMKKNGIDMGDRAVTQLEEFVAHQALDSIEEHVWRTSNMYLRVCDAFNDCFVSAFCTASHAKFLLLHKPKATDEAIKQFFSDIHELFIKILLNPLHHPRGSITSTSFYHRVLVLSRKYFNT